MLSLPWRDSSLLRDVDGVTPDSGPWACCGLLGVCAGVSSGVFALDFAAVEVEVSLLLDASLEPTPIGVVPCELRFGKSCRVKRSRSPSARPSVRCWLATICLCSCSGRRRFPGDCGLRRNSVKGPKFSLDDEAPLCCRDNDLGRESCGEIRAIRALGNGLN